MKHKMFNTKEEALKDFASKAIPMTDAVNREHAAILIKEKNRYYYTKIERGFQYTVWPTALKYLYIRKEKFFMHTHPNHGWADSKGNLKDNNPFSGVPGSRKITDAGDAFVVDILGYKGIYLVSAMGNVYLYEGAEAPRALKNTFASTKEQLNALKPIMTGLTRSEYCYRKIAKSKRGAVQYKKEKWMPK